VADSHWLDWFAVKFQAGDACAGLPSKHRFGGQCVFEYSTRRLEPCAQCQLYLVWSSVSFPGNSHISFSTLLHKHFVLFRHALCDGLILPEWQPQGDDHTLLC
jgi:hypothetical protein